MRLVERYDGDGQDDMPGLKYPIKYWEVANEPEMQREPLILFQGSSKDYFEILKATYQAVKEADSQGYAVQGNIPVSKLMEREKEPHLTSSPSHKEGCPDIGHCVKILIITGYSAPNNSSPQIITWQLGQNCSVKNLKTYWSWLFDVTSSKLP